MKIPTQILYPRYSAKLSYDIDKEEESKLIQQISDIENGEVIKKLIKLRDSLRTLESKSHKFTCEKCKKQTRICDLTLYTFVSYSNTMDNDRYEDCNIICSDCGTYHHIKGDKQWCYKYPFKGYVNIEE